MTLFWFLIGILIILCVSRYNEDESLFWKLFVSFIGAFLATAVACTYINSQKQSKVVQATSAPTQVLYSGSHVCVLADPSVTVTNAEPTAVPVSKDMVCDYVNPALSKVGVQARDQPTITFDTS